MKKSTLMLVGLLALAFVLRLYAAHYTDVATDEMIYSIVPWNIISAGRLSTVDQSPVYFYLADLGYMLLGGVTAVSVRITSVIFGALTVLVVFLLTRKVFNEKAGLWAAFFWAVSGFALRNQVEMDMVGYFLVFLGVYFFIVGWKEEKEKFVYGAFLILALAVMVKSIAFIFFAVVVIALVLHCWKKDALGKIVLSKKNLKVLGISLGVALLSVSPVLIYNYLLYENKGVTDYYFSNVVGIGETVHKGLEGKPWAFLRLVDITGQKVVQFLSLDGALFLFGLAGIWFVWKKERQFTLFLLALLILPFLYLAGQTGSHSHYLFVSVLLSVFAGVVVPVLAEKIKTRFSFKYCGAVIVTVTLLFSLVTLVQVGDLREKSIALSLRDYVNEEIPDEAVVVIDPRIYNGINAWVFHDKHYLDGVAFPQVVEQLKKTAPTSYVPLYYVECGKGTYCGWKPEDFERISPLGEQLSGYFQERLEKVGEVKAEHHFVVYKGEIPMSAPVLEAIDRTHMFWFYPVGWKYPEYAVDNYTLDSAGEKFLHYFGMFILWVDVVVALLSIPLVVWMGLRKERDTFIN